jgi:multiple sugar transport system ATP-binding protein
MATVSFQNIKKSVGKTDIIHGISFDITDGEFVVLVGPSGCGNSTLLRMLAGLEEITGGEILIDDKVVNDLESKDRDIAMVFQSYALYPHMTVRDNMAFSLLLRKADPDKTNERVAHAAKILNLEHLLHRFRVSCLAVNANGWPWDVRLCATPKSFCSTSPCPISTPSCVWRCVPKSRPCISA